jgi:formylglycine-generating enzyme required for sulfatase activity
MIPCPSREQLQELLAEQLSEPLRETIEDHVEACAACAEVLAGLSDQVETIDWQYLRSGRPGSVPDSDAAIAQYLKENPPGRTALGLEEVGSGEAIGFPGLPTDKGPLGQLESYHIRRELGHGHFGIVYEAYDELDRLVAIKVLKPELAASARERARFEHEARKAAAVNHEHIVTIYQVGHSPGFPLPYLVMEHVDGEPLSDRIERQAVLEAKEAARIVQQVALALAAAHARGLIHRDIKPSNILLEASSARAKLTDFGLARVADAVGGSTSQSGQIVGTPAYMSPEQILSPRQIDGRSDVYSLGVVLYQLLTGERPFRGATHLLLQQVLHDEPRPPRKLNDSIPRDLETIALKALAKAPSRRYATAGELADDLGRFLAGEPIQARAVGSVEKLWRWCGRNPAIASLLAVLAVTSALASWGSYEAYGRLQAHALRDRLLDANTIEVQTIIKDMAPYRRWIDPLLHDAYRDAEANQERRKQLHASLALLPVDPNQREYLLGRLLDAEAHEVPILREALRLHKQDLLEKLWTAAAQPAKGQAPRRLRAACALATYDPGSPQWAQLQERIADDLVSVPPVYLERWMDALRPVGSKLVASLTDIFRNAKRDPIERSAATNILAEYAANQPQVLADLLLDADEKQFPVLYAKLERYGDQGLTLLHSELDKQLRPTWSDPPLNPSWKEPDAEQREQTETAYGTLAERFAFCQTMPLREFIQLAERLRQCGYRPIRFQPYRPGEPPASAVALWVAAVWARDGQDWQMAHGLSAEELRQRDAENRKESFQPVDVTGYLSDGKEHYAALWVRVPTSRAAPGADTARWPRLLEIGLDEKQLQSKEEALGKEGYRQVACSQMACLDGKTRSCAIWSKVPDHNLRCYQTFSGTEPNSSGENHPGDLQVDVHVSRAGPMPNNGRNVDRSYTAIWHESAVLTSTEVHGLDPAQHLARCQSLLAQGYRPAALSVAEMAPGHLVTASVWHRPAVPDNAKEKLAKRQANAAVALFKKGKPEQVWPLLKHSSDPRVRSYLVHRLGPLGADFHVLVKRLQEEPDVTIRRAILLSLGEFAEDKFAPGERNLWVKELAAIYRTAADPGLHAAAEWLLRTWHQEAWLKQITDEWAKDKEQREKRLQSIQQAVAKDKEKTPPHWYVNSQGQTMVVIPGPVEFRMGSPSTEEGRVPNELPHKGRIGRTYALAAKPVTVEEFRRFLEERKLEAWFEARGQAAPLMKRYSPDEDGPIILVDWYTAAAYCNWLSEQEGLPPEQWCYETSARQLSSERLCACVALVLQHHVPSRVGAAASASVFLKDRQPQVTALKKNCLRLHGYRLPTEAEWEYACRAGAVTSRNYGETEELLPRYGWYNRNSGERSWPVGSKKPNDLGLFDMHGNVFTWCQESYKDNPTPKSEELNEDIEDILGISSTTSRVLRGGSFANHAGSVRSAYRHRHVPAYLLTNAGFRAARTFTTE